MRIFVSYARVDKPYCIQIVDSLDRHEVWFDQRLYAGQNWWKEILLRLDWCEGFVYLMSPESISSEYCRKEYELARNLGRYIIPILIRENTVLPPGLQEIQFVDLSRGLTPQGIAQLLESIRQYEEREDTPLTDIVDDSTLNVSRASDKVLGLIIQKIDNALSEMNYDQAVYVLSQARSHGIFSESLQILLEQIELLLERQSFERQIDREYRPIADLINAATTRQIGLEAFLKFRKNFPNYDPEKLSKRINEYIPNNDAVFTQRRNATYEAATRLIDVFVSYSHQDSHFIDRLSQDLETNGLNVWTDTQLEPGTPAWQESIQNAIQNSVCLVVILSPDALVSRWVGLELTYASAFEKKIFPVLIRGNEQNAVPIALIGAQRVDIRSDYDQIFKQLIPSIKKHLNLFKRSNNLL